MSQQNYFKGKDGREYPDSDSLFEANRQFNRQYLKFKGKDGREYPGSDSLFEADFNYALDKCRQAEHPIQYGFYLGDIFLYLLSEQGQKRCFSALVDDILKGKNNFVSFSFIIEEIANFVSKYLRAVREGGYFDINFLFRLEKDISKLKIFSNQFKTALEILQQILGQVRARQKEQRKQSENGKQKSGQQGRKEGASSNGREGKDTHNNMTAYNLLGIKSGASKGEIKQAYRAYIRKFHPDKASNEQEAKELTERLKIVNDFYDKNK